jgi:hypothetical protein
MRLDKETETVFRYRSHLAYTPDPFVTSERYGNSNDVKLNLQWKDRFHHISLTHQEAAALRVVIEEVMEDWD